MFGSFDWQKNIELLKLLLNHSSNRVYRAYLQGLLPLNEQDLQDLNSFYKANNSFRTNPPLLNSIPNSFQQAIRGYLKNEIELIDTLVKLLFSEAQNERREVLYNIIRRRLEAVGTLTNFFNNGFFI